MRATSSKSFLANMLKKSMQKSLETWKKKWKAWWFWAAKISDAWGISLESLGLPANVKRTALLRISLWLPKVAENVLRFFASFCAARLRLSGSVQNNFRAWGISQSSGWTTQVFVVNGLNLSCPPDGFRLQVTLSCTCKVFTGRRLQGVDWML